MDEPTLPEYHRVSVLAVLAILLGLASSGALIGGVLLALPVAGLGVGMLAIAKINASAGQYSGRALAQWGVFFSVLFGVAAVARPPLFQEIVDRQGRKFAQSWLALVVEEDIVQALKYVDMKAKGQLAPRDPQGNPEVGGDLEEAILQVFREEPAIQQLQAAGKQARVRYEQTVAMPLPTDRHTRIVQIFSITGNDSDSQGAVAVASPFYVQLYLTRTQATGDQPTVWFVDRWQLAATLSELASL